MKTIYGAPVYVGAMDLRTGARREGLPVERLRLDTMGRKIACAPSNASRACILFNADDSVTFYAIRLGHPDAFNWRAVTRQKFAADSAEARNLWKQLQQA